MDRFPLIDQYLSAILDIDVVSLPSGKTVVAETTRRLQPEISYSFVHALYGIFFTDGRVAFSVTPGSRAEIAHLLQTRSTESTNTPHQDWLDRLLASINQARSMLDLPPATRIYESRLFACNGSLLQRHHQGDCRCLVDESIPAFDGLWLPAHCFPDGIVYGVVADGQVVSVAYAHRSGLMEDRVADLAVETAAPYRKHGYASTVVSAVTEHITSAGGEAVYNCSPNNLGSIATASSVGYVLYGRTIVVAAPAPEEKLHVLT